MELADLREDGDDGGDGDDGSNGGVAGGGGGGNGLGGDEGDDETAGARWLSIAGADLEQLALLGHTALPAPLSASLRAALPRWRHSLRVLHLGADALSSLCHGVGAVALIAALPPTLETLGTVDCSWLAPTWFFEALAEATPPQQAPPPLSRLTQLSVFVNSPGAGASGLFAAPNYAPVSGEYGDYYAASFEDGCALHVACGHAAARLPALRRLLITWYEEDDIEVAGVAAALAPLAAAPRLREVCLMRSGENCGALVLGATPSDAAARHLAPSDAARHLAQALAEAADALAGGGANGAPPVRVRVHEAPQQALGTEQPLWELDDAADVLGDGALCRGLAPRYEARHEDAVN